MFYIFNQTTEISTLADTPFCHGTSAAHNKQFSFDSKTASYQNRIKMQQIIKVQ